MKVVYVSKASRVAAHRDKPAALARRVDLTLVMPTRWGGQPDEPALPGDPRTIALPALLHGHNHFHLYRGLGAVLDAERPDLVHADEEPYSAVTGQVAALCARRGIPFVFFAWQNIPKRLPAPFVRLRRAVFARAAGAIAGTPRAADVLREWGWPGHLAVIPQMGVDEARFRPDLEARRRVRERLGVAETTPLVGYVGRLVPEKGVDMLIDALAALPGAVLAVVGGGPEEEELRRRAHRRGVSDRVRFAGAVPSAQVPEWMAALDVLSLPSRTTRGWSEQFGRVLVEAMACGVVVVGSDSGEIPWVVGEGGIVFPEDEPAVLVRTLRGLCGSPERRAEIGARGKARVLARFTNERIVEETLHFYEEVLAGRGAGPRPAVETA